MDMAQVVASWRATREFAAARSEGWDAMSAEIDALNNSTDPVLLRWTKTTSQLRRPV
jgi:hypothetical protein